MPSHTDLANEFSQMVFGALNESTLPSCTCIQVGAFDGIRWDPVHQQVTRHGWNLYPLEPHPEYFRQLCKNYSDLPNVKPIQIAISNKNEAVMLYFASAEASQKYPAWLQGCSTVHVQRLNQAIETAVRNSKKPRGRYDIDAIPIVATTLDQFISEHSIASLDVLVVVAEGHEAQVLSSLQRASHKPRLAIVQCNGPNRSDDLQYLIEMNRLGLRVWRFGDDLWGINEELASTGGIKELTQRLANAELTQHIERKTTRIREVHVQSQTNSSVTFADRTGKLTDEVLGVPKKLGHIWIGYKAPPLKWMKTWQENHPDWDYQVFDNNYLINRRWRNERLIAEYVQRGRFEGASDLMRYEILLEQGGFIPEADSTCLKNTNILFSQPSLYTVYEHESREPDFVSPFLAGVKNHPFLELVVQHLSDHQTPRSLRGPFRSVGNKFLGDMIKRHRPEVSIFPSYFFIPNHLRSKEYSGTGPVFADQHWGSSRKSYADHPLEKTVELATNLRDWARSILS